ncbi:MAG TPA: YicC/YloC family endoribonuclease [Clostridia bacterium]|nr:YicC/YloC family endoribonuclease [Clostridia bacterium]
MIKSMTGYGRGEYDDGTVSLTAEIKTLNHKYNDIIIKLPKKLSLFEEKVRNLIKGKITRGRVEIYIHIDESKSGSVQINPNFELIDKLMQALNDINEKYELNKNVGIEHLLKFEDILSIEPVEEDLDELWVKFEACVSGALNDLMEMRQDEGKRISVDIMERVETVSSCVDDIGKRIPDVVKEYKEKLNQRINELLSDTGTQIEESRLALEVAVYADRSDITEEIVRIKSHLKELEKIPYETAPVGRKLDFLMQEMNREVNTVGSKSQDKEITSIVIDLKSELSKIREQVQNIE